MLRLCAAYLAQTSSDEARISDPVARFHLNNGAMLDRINLMADTSAKGLRQSFGLMVNYRYELDLVEERHERFTRGEVACSSQVKSHIKS
jgi:malonyl-CoA decarboxylase